MIITHTVSLLEIVWTLISVCGLYYNARVFSRALGDWMLVRINEINGIIDYSAATTLSLFTALLVVQIMFVLDGVLAMCISSPNNHVQGLSYIITSSFVLVSVIMAGTGYIQDKRRQALAAKIRLTDRITQERAIADA